MAHRVFMIAGEASGDALGGPLIKALKQKVPDIDIQGIGGHMMKAAGMPSKLPMEDLCVMGLWEVLGQIPRLHKLIHSVVEEIENINPDIVVTIDLPDFNFRVAKLLKERGKCNAKIVHYVAPTVWAWRPKRAEKIAQFLDGLLCLFPFEPEYFTPHDLPARFVGHSLIEHAPRGLDKQNFRQRNDIPMDAVTLGVMFGSRSGEIEKMSGVLAEAVQVLKEQNSDLHIIVPTLPDLEYDVLRIVNQWDLPVTVISNPDLKWEAFAACDMALAVSGTVGLELAYMDVPHVIAYKMHPVSWMLVRLLVKVKYAHLANILLDQPNVPEYLQYDCTPIKIAKGLLVLSKDHTKAEKQRDAFTKVRDMLGETDQSKPSERAAEYILGYLS